MFLFSIDFSLKIDKTKEKAGEKRGKDVKKGKKRPLLTFHDICYFVTLFQVLIEKKRKRERERKGEKGRGEKEQDFLLKSL